MARTRFKQSSEKMVWKSHQSQSSVKRESRQEAISDLLHDFSHGSHFVISNFGQFSLIDSIGYFLSKIGPSSALISSWTVSMVDLRVIAGFILDEKITDLKLLLDASMKTRSVSTFYQILEALPNSIALTNNHAKFITMQNREWNIAIRSSMNLNCNRRLELFEVSDDESLCSFLRQITNPFFEDMEESLHCSRPDHTKKLKQLALRNDDSHGKSFGINFSNFSLPSWEQNSGIKFTF